MSPVSGTLMVRQQHFDPIKHLSLQQEGPLLGCPQHTLFGGEVHLFAVDISVHRSSSLQLCEGNLEHNFEWGNDSGLTFFYASGAFRVHAIFEHGDMIQNMKTILERAMKSNMSPPAIIIHLRKACLGIKIIHILCIRAAKEFELEEVDEEVHLELFLGMWNRPVLERKSWASWVLLLFNEVGNCEP
ncbi:uncharacterized protein EI90DRAFT_3014873 [Cantharellus anzutake]|uniref:uncharacterized protein n=1 Tax=Cantharellus anzutake TaxID=1750568 RepID=UPI001906C2F0|nr:uncharacterized protein EI90DRAFT_3014873 [Cantharellus anzutake]KAF8334585.1 hypothetical protein EI90DRAFT_3014873 [Cantharellus anzutake]